jgi:hypothetical protein
MLYALCFRALLCYVSYPPLTSLLYPYLCICVCVYVLGSVAAVLVYREVIEAAGSMNSMNVETYDDIKRVSTVDLLRRRAQAEVGNDGSYAYAHAYGGGHGRGGPGGAGGAGGAYERYERCPSPGGPRGPLGPRGPGGAGGAGSPGQNSYKTINGFSNTNNNDNDNDNSILNTNDSSPIITPSSSSFTLHSLPGAAPPMSPMSMAMSMSMSMSMASPRSGEGMGTHNAHGGGAHSTHGTHSTHTHGTHGTHSTHTHSTHSAPSTPSRGAAAWLVSAIESYSPTMLKKKGMHGRLPG